MRSYRVVRGDTLGGLAARFDVPLDALVRINHKQNNPDLIREGETLQIPRSRLAYDTILESLEGLAREADRDYQDRLDELNAIEREGATFGGRIDLTADILTCFVGMGKATLTYGGVVRNAALRKGTFKAVEKVIVHAATNELPSAVGGLAFKAVGNATADQYLRAIEQVGPVNPGQFAKSIGKDASKGIAKHLIKSHIAVDKQSATELFVVAAIQFAFTGLQKASDLAGAIAPSTLAHVYMRLHDGEDLRTSLFKSRQSIDVSHQRVKHMLATRIASIRAERAQVYK